MGALVFLPRFFHCVPGGGWSSPRNADDPPRDRPSPAEEAARDAEGVVAADAVLEDSSLPSSDAGVAVVEVMDG